MTDALVTEGLAVAESHLHINCTSHNDQTALRNAVEKVYGIGGIIKRNLPQFIHAFSDVQGSFPGGSHEIKPLMIAAWKYVHGDDAEPPPNFLTMMQEPILTRWGTVGEACQYVWVSKKYHRSYTHRLSFKFTLCHVIYIQYTTTTTTTTSIDRTHLHLSLFKSITY